MERVVWVLRIALAGIFAGHGMLAFGQKEGWYEFFEVVSIPRDTASWMMQVIGIADMAIAVSVLIKPWKPVLYWCVFWTTLTALMRPISGESWLEFVERFGNIGVPLALVLILSQKNLLSASTGVKQKEVSAVEQE